MFEDRFERLAENRIGTVLGGKYAVERLLGIGGMAAVYCARDRTGRKFALKVLHPSIAEMPDMRRRFLREGYVANAIKHPGAIKVLDSDDGQDGEPFLVMELLRGRTLEDEKFSTRRALIVTAKLLDVLASAHAEGLIHRDIKPDNVFITESGELKVLDFGIARLRRELGESTQLSTRDGTLMGTPGFMAPEQAVGRQDAVDSRSDLFAVGATLFHLLTGRPIFEGTPNAVLILTATRQCPPIRDVLPNVPSSIAHVVDKALAFDSNTRWPDAASMRDAVVRAYRELWGGPFPASVPRFDAPEVPQRARRAGLWAAVAGAVVAVGAIVTVLAQSGRSWRAHEQPASVTTLSLAAVPAAPAPVTPSSAFVPVSVEPTPAPTLTTAPPAHRPRPKGRAGAKARASIPESTR
jgi:serine/threonine-protein kinase